MNRIIEGYEVPNLALVLTFAGSLLVATGASAQMSEFVEVAGGLAIADTSGNEFEIPFFGGFNNPVPQLVDIDGDGDADLFVQEERLHLQQYVNVGSIGNPQFELVSRNYNNLDVGDWYRFVDADGDGDYDLLAGQPFNFVKYFENVGTVQDANYELREDSLRTATGEFLTTEPPNVPAIADYDCDGNLNLLLGRVDGTITHFELQSVVNGIPSFRFVEDNFQNISVVGSSGKSTSRHGANALAAGDINADGLLDLVWGDFFEPSVITFTNEGSTCSDIDLNRTSDTLRTASGGAFITRGYNAPTFASLSSPNAADLVIGVQSNSIFDDVHTLFRFDNDGSGGLSLVTDRLIYGVDTGSASVPAFVDINEDGLRDLIVANSIGDSGTTAELDTYLQESGGFRQVAIEWPSLPEAFSYHPAFSDLDADGDDDMLLGLFNGTVLLFENTGASADTQFVLVNTDILNEDVGSNAAPHPVDLDGDGDFDLIVGESSGILNYYENIGTPSTATFTADPSMFDSFDVGQNSAPATYDSNGDGLQDIVVGSESQGLLLLLNTGTLSLPSFDPPVGIEIKGAGKAAPEFELLSEGKTARDLVVGNISGGLLFFQNTRTSEGLEELPEVHLEFDIYPNPANRSVSVTLGNSGFTNHHITITDMLGRTVRRSQPAPEGRTTTLDISRLPAGIYILRITGHTVSGSRPLVVYR